jgi:phage baseplate assembly protein W
MANTNLPITTAVSLVPLSDSQRVTDVSAFYGITGNDAVMTYGSDAIGGEIFNVFSTLVGDEPFEPTYGCDLPLRVFEPNIPITQMLCRQDVYFAARNWVPHAQVNDGQTQVVADASNRMVAVDVAFAFGGKSWSVSLPLNLAFGGSI